MLCDPTWLSWRTDSPGFRLTTCCALLRSCRPDRSRVVFYIITFIISSFPSLGGSGTILENFVGELPVLRALFSMRSSGHQERNELLNPADLLESIVAAITEMLSDAFFMSRGIRCGSGRAALRRAGRTRMIKADRGLNAA
jgi:hypothetical protein